MLHQLTLKSLISIRPINALASSSFVSPVTRVTCRDAHFHLIQTLLISIRFALVPCTLLPDLELVCKHFLPSLHEMPPLPPLSYNYLHLRLLCSHCWNYYQPNKVLKCSVLIKGRLSKTPASSKKKRKKKEGPLT